MTKAEVLAELENYGQASIKKVLLKHGINEPLWGVKVEDMKKILKKTKANHELSLELYDTGIYDAMYLAGLMADENRISKEDLKRWAIHANSPALHEYTVPWIAAESRYGLELALEWIEADEEGIASTGWATLSNLVSIKEDKELNIELLKQLLDRVAAQIHSNRNRVKYAMNGFVIATACFVKELTETGKQTAQKIGKVDVDMGDTACKIPSALEYIQKTESKNYIGKKRKAARC